jgi:hypothetical protein
MYKSGQKLEINMLKHLVFEKKNDKKLLSYNYVPFELFIALYILYV